MASTINTETDSVKGEPSDESRRNSNDPLTTSNGDKAPVHLDSFAVSLLDEGDVEKGQAGNSDSSSGSEDEKPTKDETTEDTTEAHSEDEQNSNGGNTDQDDDTDEYESDTEAYRLKNTDKRTVSKYK